MVAPTFTAIIFFIASLSIYHGETLEDTAKEVCEGIELNKTVPSSCVAGERPEDVSEAFLQNGTAILKDGSRVKCCCSHGKCVLRELPEHPNLLTLMNSTGCGYLLGMGWHSFLKSPSGRCIVSKGEANDFNRRIGKIESETRNAQLGVVSMMSKNVFTHRAQHMFFAEDWKHDIAAVYCWMMNCTQSIDDIISVYVANKVKAEGDTHHWIFGNESATTHSFTSSGIAMSDHRPVSVDVRGFGQRLHKLFTWNVEGFGSYKQGFHGSNRLMLQRREELRNFVESTKMNSIGAIIVLQELVLKSDKDISSATRFMDEFKVALGSNVTWEHSYDGSTGAVIYDAGAWNLKQVIQVGRDDGEKKDQSHIPKYSTYYAFHNKETQQVFDLVNIHLQAMSSRKSHVAELTNIWEKLKARMENNFDQMLIERSLTFLGDFNDASDKEIMIRESFQHALPIKGVEAHPYPSKYAPREEDISNEFLPNGTVVLRDGSQVKCCCREQEEKKCILMKLETQKWLDYFVNTQGCGYLVAPGWHSHSKTESRMCLVSEMEAEHFKRQIRKKNENIT